MSPVTRLKFQRGAGHLHRCGARTIAEFLEEVARRTGGESVIMAALDEYKPLTHAMLRAAGGDRFPVRPLRRVS